MDGGGVTAAVAAGADKATSTPGGLPVATATLIAAKLRAVLDRRPDARVVAIGAGGWPGEDEVDVGGRTVRVMWCPSPLAVREVLASPGPGCTVIVTPCDRTDLGVDVLARLERATVLPLDRWQIVEDMFSAHGIDRRVVDASGLLDTLIDLAPASGYPAAVSGFLDLDTACEAPLRVAVGVENPADLTGLLHAVRRPDARGAWATLRPEVRAFLVGWLASRHHPAAGAIIATLDVPDDWTSDALVVGLVSRVVLAEPGGPPPDPADLAIDPGLGGRALDQAAARLEPLTAGMGRGERAASAWAGAAEDICRGLGAAAAPLYRRAEALLDEVGAGPFAHLSPVLPLGFTGRLRQASAALDRVLDLVPQDAARGAPAVDPAEKRVRLADLDAAVTRVRGHHAAGAQRRRVDSLAMAARAARWLLVPPTAPAASFTEAAQRYRDEGAWVDRAYAAVARGESDDQLAASYTRLLDLVEARRVEEDRRFGELLADWMATGGGDVAQLEGVLDDIVAPLAEAGRPVLLVVLDGLSSIVAAELFAAVADQGWSEVLADGGRQYPVVAPLPTLTRVCRTSLLSGRLEEGDARTEARNFTAHPRLVAASSRTRPPIAFHKAELTAAAGATLPEPVMAALAQPSQRIVAAVVNTVDDHLSKGQQLDVEWTVDAVAPLRALLDLAAVAGRVVVLTADHGHVIDRGSEARRGSGGERWRADDTPAADGEVRVTGPRVLDGAGTIVVPWASNLRYGMKKHGYHGGGSPAEVVVPLAVFANQPIDGWDDAPPRGPAWWDDLPPALADTEIPAPAPTPRPSRARKPAKDAPAERLFAVDEPASPDIATPTPTAAAAGEDRGVGAPGWVGRLFSSETYQAQEQRAGRAALARDRVAHMVGALDARGGTLTWAALGRAARVPDARLAGAVAGLTRLLNVEGFPVVTIDDSSVTLDRALLDRQFGLDARPGGGGSR
jgi:hypothetical protein